MHYSYFQVCFTCECTLRACTPDKKKEEKKNEVQTLENIINEAIKLKDGIVYLERTSPNPSRLPSWLPRLPGANGQAAAAPPESPLLGPPSQLPVPSVRQLGCQT